MQEVINRSDLVIFIFLIKKSVLKEETEPNRIISVWFRFGPYAKFGLVRSKKKLQIRFSVLPVRFGSGPNRPNAQPYLIWPHGSVKEACALGSIFLGCD